MLRRIAISLLIGVAMTITVTVVGAQSKSTRLDAGAAAASQKNKLEGTWLATVTFSDGFQLKVLFTFMPGRSDNEGTLIDTNEFELTPNPICTPDQGVWERTGDRDFIATHLTFCFDTTKGSVPAGTAKVRDSIRIGNRPDTFTGTQYVEVFDTAGNLVATFDATMQATRLRAEAPPQP